MHEVERSGTGAPGPIRRPAPSVLLVLPWSPDLVGGVNQVVINLHRQFARSGTLRPRVLIDTYSRGTIRKLGTDALGEVDAFYLPAPSGPGKGLRHFVAFACGLPRAALTLARYLERENVRVVNIHYPSLSLVCVLLARRLAAKTPRVVLSFHGSDLNAPQAAGLVQRRLWRLAVRACDAVVACSHALGKTIERCFPGLGAKLHVVHNGVDIAACQSAASHARPPGELEGRPYISCVATFEAKKGLDVLVAAFRTIAADHPELCLALAGGSGPTLGDLRRLASTSPFRDRIFFYPDVPHAQALALIAGAQVLVLPSRQEPFGIVVLEAASLGIPVVASRVGGLPEILQDGRSGRLVTPESADDLARAIAGVLHDRPGAQARAANLLEAARARFTWEQAAAKYAAIYAMSAAKRPARPSGGGAHSAG